MPADKSAEGPQPIMERTTSRRNVLRRGAAVAVGAVGAAALAQAGVRSAEAGGGSGIIDTERYCALPPEVVKKHPELQGLQARVVALEGPRIVDSTKNGTKVYQFHAENGQEISSYIDEAEGDGYVRSTLLDAHGNDKVTGRWNVLKSMVFKRGNYFLVVSNGEGRAGGGFELSLRDDNERKSNDVVYNLHPGINQTSLRYSPEGGVLTIPDNNASVTISLKKPLFKNDGSLDGDVKVYALAGTKRNHLMGAKAIRAEDDEKNVIPSDIKIVGDKSIEVFASVNGERVFPEGSQISIVIRRSQEPNAGYGARFYTP